MRPLVIDEEAKDKIKDLILFAEENIVTMDHLLDMYNDAVPQIVDDPQRRVELFGGFLVTYSIEQQFHPTEGEVRVKHLAIALSPAKEKAMPSVPHCYLIMGEFDIKDFDKCKVQIDQERSIVEIWEPIFGKPIGPHFSLKENM